MDLKCLLQPGGDPWRPIPYLLVFSLLGASGPLAVALQYRDWFWSAELVSYSVYATFLILGAAHGLRVLFGERLPAWAVLAIAVVAGSVAAQALGIYLVQDVCGIEPYPGKTYLYHLALARGPILWWGLGAAAWYSSMRARERMAEVAQAELASDELRASTAEARLQALQAQVEPHFLFNTLAHVKWLYRRDPERGRHMLERLLLYLQAALPRVRQSSTTLEQELQLTRAYLDIHQLRIGGRLGVTIEVPEDIARLRFPSLMLLTLVENAIKHGIAPQTEGGTIAIRAEADDRQLRIEVRDTGAGLTQSAGTGLGLANVRARLSALFGAGARLVIEPNAPRGVVAAIEIPR